MSFLDLAKKRYSVRNYQPQPVEQEKLDMILEAGRVAPTAVNKQPNHFLVVNSPEALAKLSKGTNPHKAPLAIIICGNTQSVWVRPVDKHSMIDIDATIATDHMMLCAEDLGLSSCWLTAFDPEIIRKEFNIPETLCPVNILVLGYSADIKAQSSERHAQTRKSISSLVSYNSF